MKNIVQKIIVITIISILLLYTNTLIVSNAANEISNYQAEQKQNESKITENEIEIPVQIKGKVRATITIKKDEDEEVVKQKAKEAVAGQIEGKRIIKEIYVKNKIYNIVIK